MRRQKAMFDFVPNFLLYLIVMAGVTYLVRMLPLVLVRKKIENRFIRSFLYYVPYSVLSVMTFPAVLFSTGSIISAVLGTAVAVVLAYRKKSLIIVAAAAALAVFICELVMMFI
jgi:branched-subunit amino acid transport protein